ncbi:MAG: 16S rRNA (guanine(527)-N(7))-methyltransferase RsmG [Thermoguttaceae bacterium]
MLQTEQSDTSELIGELTQTLSKYSISISPKKVKQLAHYASLLWGWNEKLNLTRHTDCEKFVTRDIVDSLALAEFLLPNERILDVGTGGGVPGILLTILRPDLHIELCDSTGKKAKVVAEIIQEMGLRLPVYHSKAESLFPESRFSTLVVRAVSKMPKLLQMFAPHWHFFERILLLKGPNWVEERGESRHVGLMKNLALRVLKTYDIPSINENGLKSLSSRSVAQGSVVLQICQKDKFATLPEHIAASLVEKKPVKPRKRKKDYRPRKQ